MAMRSISLKAVNFLCEPSELGCLAEWNFSPALLTNFLVIKKSPNYAEKKQ